MCLNFFLYKYVFMTSEMSWTWTLEKWFFCSAISNVSLVKSYIPSESNAKKKKQEIDFFFVFVEFHGQMNFEYSKTFFLIIQSFIFLFGIYKIKLTLNINDDQAKITSIRNNPLQNNRTYVNTHNWIFISRNINVLSNEIPV